MKNKQPIYKRPWFLVIVGIVALGLIFGDTEEEPETPAQPVASVQEEKLPPPPKVKPEKQEPVKVEVEEPAPAPEPEPAENDKLPTPLESAYFQEMFTAQGPLADYLEEFGMLMGEYNPFDSQWTYNAALYITLIQNTAEEMRSITPPGGRVKTAHDTYVSEGIDYLYDSMDLMIKGIDDMDVEAVEKAIVYMEKYTEATDDYTNWLNSTFDF